MKKINLSQKQIVVTIILSLSISLVLLYFTKKDKKSDPKEKYLNPAQRASNTVNAGMDAKNKNKFPGAFNIFLSK
jgi:plastocyanin domain-containing protein